MTRKEVEGLGRASLSSSTFNLINSCIGAGILGLPHAMSDLGFVPALGCSVVCGAFSAFSLHLLSCAHHRLLDAGIPSSFYAVAAEATPWLCAVTDLSVVLNCLGNGCVYLIVVGDQMPAVMDFAGAGHTAQRRQLWVLAAFVAACPLSFMRNIDSLRYTSAVGVVVVVFIMIMIVLYALDIEGLDPCHGVPPNVTCAGETGLVEGGTGAAKGVMVFIYGYVCHFNIFNICNELRDPKPARYDAVIVTSMASTFLIYAAIAVAGYSTYGALVQDDIIKSYPVVTVVTIMRVTFSISVLSSYPLQVHPTRRCMMSLWQQAVVWHRARGGGEGAEAAADPGERELEVRWWSCTTFFLAVSVAVALTVDNLGVVLSIAGATASTLVSYIVPGACYYCMFTHPHAKRTGALALALLGCAIVPAALVIIFV